MYLCIRVSKSRYPNNLRRKRGSSTASQGNEQEGKSTLDDLKSYAAEKAKEAEQKMEKDGPEQDRGLEL
jgi:hypothetical protein